MSWHDFGPDAGGRVKGLQIVKPVVFGNLARYFGRTREEDGHTHQWTVYVKPFANEDMSTYVKKVHFELHESYSNQNRIITKMPFEVTEMGYSQLSPLVTPPLVTTGILFEKYSHLSPVVASPVATTVNGHSSSSQLSPVATDGKYKLIRHWWGRC